MRQPKIMDPTLNDIVAQHFGVNRDKSPEPRIRATRKMSDWMALYTTMEPDDICSSRLLAERFDAMITFTGMRKTWEDKNKGFEIADVYHTPDLSQHDLREKLHTRRTEGPLRDAIVSSIAVMRRWLKECEELPECSEITAFFSSPPPFDIDDSTSPEDIEMFEGFKKKHEQEQAEKHRSQMLESHDPVEIDGLSDWNLATAWSSALVRTAYFALVRELPAEIDAPLMPHSLAQPR